MLSKRPDSQRGATVLLFTFCTLMLVIPLVGLAIDGSIALWTKAKLAAAVDAAALAAGRSVNVSGDAETEQSVAQGVATKWFNANFPAGWLGATVLNGGAYVPLPTISDKTITITVKASVQAPLFFLRILGKDFQNVTVSASAESSRRNLVLILVLDTSGSMSDSGSCTPMKTDAENFVNLFTDGFDELGLVTFSTTANLAYSPGLDFKTGSPTLTSVIGKISCAGATSTTQALNVAYNAITHAGPEGTGEPGALNVIVLFTDGQPNTILAQNWPINSSGSCTNPQTTGIIPGTASGMPVGAITTTGSDPSDSSPYGMYDPSKSQGNSYSKIPTSDNATGCLFESSGFTAIGGQGGWHPQPADIGSIPSQDFFGNLTTGYQDSNMQFDGSDIVFNGNDMVYAAFNTADSQAHTIRYDTTYQPMIFTIGLGNSGLGGDGEEFLERLANDPRSTSYDPTIAAGAFAYAPDPSQLQVAFYQIASEILRLSQ